MRAKNDILLLGPMQRLDHGDKLTFHGPTVIPDGTEVTVIRTEPGGGLVPGRIEIEFAGKRHRIDADKLEHLSETHEQ